jgi:hypothetical protein
MSTSMGVKYNDPEVENAKQQVLQTCRATKIVCGARASTPAEVAKRVKESSSSSSSATWAAASTMKPAWHCARRARN